MGKKEPRIRFLGCGANTWRRPTLTGPIVPLPLALRRFTSGFGMGPGGSTALWSPECEFQVSSVQFQVSLNGLEARLLGISALRVAYVGYFKFEI
jgi:hypothetical protein